MLTEQQLEIFGERFVPIFQRLEAEVINDIARRVQGAERYTATAALQADALRQLGWSPAQIQSEVLKRLQADEEFERLVAENTKAYRELVARELDFAEEELDRISGELWEEVGDYSFDGDLAYWGAAGQTLARTPAIKQIVEALSERATGEIMNLIKTKLMGFRTSTGSFTNVNQAYYNVLTDALVKTITGSFSYQEAINAAVKELASSGLRKVDYPKGVKGQSISRNLDVTARLTTLTASAQISGQITQKNIEQTGVEHVEVSSHGGARPSHARWEGQVYSLKEFVSRCGYGGHGADDIYGYNCRHRHYPFWEGVSKRLKPEKEPEAAEINGRPYTYYQATQHQRAMERSVRAMKREKSALGEMGQPTTQLNGRIRGKTAEYNSFSEKAGISAKPARLRVDNSAGMVYDKSITDRLIAKESAAIKRIADKKVKDKKIAEIRKQIKSDSTNKKLNIGNQNKHIKKKGYTEGRSYIYGDLETSQEFIDKYHGTGEIRLRDNGEWIGKEFITVDGDIGVHINKTADTKTATNRFSIHYGKKGTHIVPAERRD